MRDDLFVYSFIGAGFGIYSFYRGFKRLRLKRMVEDIPTSKVQSMAMGLVEVKGEAVPIFNISSPFGKKPCAYYRYRVQEYRRHRGGGHWTTVAKGNSSAYPFFLEDETGCALIDPIGAEFDVEWEQIYKSGLFSNMPAGITEALNKLGYKSRFFSRTLRIQEYCIVPRQAVYVLGFAKTWELASKSKITKRFKFLNWRKEVLRLKYNKKALKKYDLNKDGKIDQAEWEKAKQTVAREVQRKLSSGAQNIPVVQKSPEAGIFHISSKSEKELTKSLGINCFLGIFGGAALSLACTVYILKELSRLLNIW